jgi:hypothetical protein
VSAPSGRRRGVDIPADDEEDMSTTEDFLNISDALKLVRDPLTDTQAPKNVEQTVWERIARSDFGSFSSSCNTHIFSERYPSSLSHHVHKAKAYLPVDVAKALSVDPALVQKAAEAFYTRDALQLRVRIGSYTV